MSLGTIFFRRLHGSRLKSLAGIPGPTPSFPFGTALDFRGKLPWEVCARYAHEYGGVTLIWIMGRPALVLNDPGLIGEVLDTRTADFYKNSPRNALRPILTDDEPFISNGLEWSFNRENHPLLMKQLDAWLASQLVPAGKVIRTGVRRLIEQSASAPVDFTQVIQRLSFDAFAMMVWGRVLDDNAYAWFLRMARAGDCRMNLDLALPGLPPLGPGAALARRSWFGLAEQLYKEASNDKALSERTDLLGVWLRHGSNLKPTAFCHAVANIFYGGVFSVTSVLVTCFYLLAHDLAAEECLRAEVHDLMKRNSDFDRAALDECVFLDAVLRESMRSCPPVPLYFRNVVPDRAIEFAGHTIPADTLIFITNWFLHRESAHWKNPGQFDPGRWKGDGKERDPLGSGYFFPFGRGPRTCLGMPFALFFMKLALATIVGESRIELDRSLSYVQDFFFGVMMPKGLKGHFRPGIVSNVGVRGASLSA